MDWEITNFNFCHLRGTLYNKCICSLITQYYHHEICLTILIALASSLVLLRSGTVPTLCLLNYTNT